MIYIDTSVLVASLTVETSTRAAQAWLALHAHDTLGTSPWVKTELYSALSMKLRLKEISDSQHGEASHRFIVMEQDTLIELAVTHSHFERAAFFVARHELKLRAPDALHLAIASDNGASLCTLDQTLFDAAKALGIRAEMP